MTRYRRDRRVGSFAEACGAADRHRADCRERMRVLRAGRQALSKPPMRMPPPRPSADPAPTLPPAAPALLPDQTMTFAGIPADPAVRARHVATWTRLLGECPADYPLRRASIIARLAELGAQP
jgi:hypothetical protein